MCVARLLLDTLNERGGTYVWLDAKLRHRRILTKMSLKDV